MALSPTPTTSANGNISGTTITVTLPTYSLSDYMIMIVSSNQTFAKTFSANVTATVLFNASNRLTAYRIVPSNGSQTSFTFTVSTSAFFTWWVATYAGVDSAAVVYGNALNIGNSTSNLISVPVTTLGYIATGNELVIWAGGSNSSVTWTTDGNTQFSTGTSTNAALMVEAANTTATNLTASPADMNRGLSGTSRNVSALSLVLQPTGNNATLNLLANPSFEVGSTIATSWQDEHTTVGAATYSLVNPPVTDGKVSQQMTYTGQAGDTTGIVEIFQSPITGMNPGDILTFSVYLSGSLTNTYCFIGIEGFTSGNVYISENDTNVVSLTGTPTQYTVVYTAPANNDHVAVYLQVPSIGPTVAFTIQLDKATLVKTSGITHNLTLLGVGS